MVIVRLIGGLANQMFPYAAGRRLAHVLGAELKLDVSGFSVYEEQGELDFRRYSLGLFNIIESFATTEEIKSLTDCETRFLDKLLRRKPRIPSTYVKEKHYHFDPGILRLQGSVYLQGNWNSEKYFADIDDIIRQEFTLKQPPTGRNLELLDEIAAVESVSIHIRRGDYVSNPRANQVHGIVDLDYYLSGIEIIAGRVVQPHFFVFSDDIEWARRHLRLSWPCTFVDHNGPLEGHEDMRLMSRCSHNIIANSGFSWWAAWLNPNPHKLVLAPKKWFGTDKYSTRSLFPESWLLR
jgi:hypothetical protein